MGSHVDDLQDANAASTSEPKPEESGVEARVGALWEQMNKGFNKNAKHESKKRTHTSLQKPNDVRITILPVFLKRVFGVESLTCYSFFKNWMTYLGLTPKTNGSPANDAQQKGSPEELNKRIPSKEVVSSPNKSSTSVDQTSQKKSDSWKNYLGLGTKQAAQSSALEASSQEKPNGLRTSTSEEAKKFAAAALSAVKDAAAAAALKGKVEIMEVRDFAGRDIEVKKLVDAESKEAAEKGKAAAAPSAVDAVLEQIKKKQKLSVLDKTKKDWGEFKEENKGLEDELETYKKSSNQYLDKQSFLQRTDYREFERERDARLAMQARRRTDMRED
ncbi:unnamed protein product [Linum tenue]|uniref:BCNT-C domain-containing protein n=1 Tax=Linum tenue TaxID=586396 RepID=A0AAV0PB80_9ROSI|nr:unnamed protein product [Linum tenue]